MSDDQSAIEALFARFVEQDVIHGRVLAAAEICGARIDLIEPLDRLIDRYRSITAALDGSVDLSERAAPSEDTLPQFDGFQTI